MNKKMVIWVAVIIALILIVGAFVFFGGRKKGVQDMGSQVGVVQQPGNGASAATTTDSSITSADTSAVNAASAESNPDEFNNSSLDDLLN